MRKWTIGGLIALLLLTLTGTWALAESTPAVRSPLVMEGRLIAADEIIDDDVIITGGRVTVDGTIKGDLIVFGPEVTVNGIVEGDLIGVASKALVRGEVRGDVRVAALQSITVEGRVGRSLTTLTTDALLGAKGQVGSTWIAFGPDVSLRGQVGRSLLTGADRLSVSGKVGRDVTAFSFTEATFGPTAVVTGDFRGTGKVEPIIQPGAQVGAVQFTPETVTWMERLNVAEFDGLELVGFLAVGLLLAWLMPNLLTSFSAQVNGRPWATLGIGTALLVGVPVAALILAFTIAGLPVVFLLLLPLYVATLYVGQMAVAGWVGQLILARVRHGQPVSSILAFLLGTVVTTLLVRLPYVKTLASFLSLALALGGLACMIYAKTRRSSL